MLRFVFFTCSLFSLSIIGCGASTGTTVPTDIQPLTEADQAAAEEYGKSQQLDPRTGQPMGQ